MFPDIFFLSLPRVTVCLNEEKASEFSKYRSRGRRSLSAPRSSYTPSGPNRNTFVGNFFLSLRCFLTLLQQSGVWRRWIPIYGVTDSVLSLLQEASANIQQLMALAGFSRQWLVCKISTPKWNVIGPWDWNLPEDYRQWAIVLPKDPNLGILKYSKSIYCFWFLTCVCFISKTVTTFPERLRSPEVGGLSLLLNKSISGFWYHEIYFKFLNWV